MATVFLFGCLLSTAASATDYLVVNTDLDTLALAVGVDARAIARENGLNGPPPPGTVVRVPGRGQWRPLEVTSARGASLRTQVGYSRPTRDGERLQAVSEVCTDASGAANLHLRVEPGHNDELAVGASTCVVFLGGASSEGRRTTFVNLLEGRVSTRSTDREGNLLIKHDNVVLSGRGFRAMAERAGVSVEVFDGEVDVYVTGIATRLVSGQALRIPARDEIGDAVQLPAAPVCTSPHHDGVLADGTFRWEPLPGSEHYLLELATGRDFGERLAFLEVQGTRWAPERLEVPDTDELWWRVAAITPDRLAGTPCAPMRLTLPTAGSLTPGE